MSSALLPYEAVFRIEVSLSSQTTSAIVMRTTARLYRLEGVQSSKPRVGDTEWKSVAYGAPCIQLVRHGNGDPNAPFTIRVVIAEVESGISLWEGMVDSNSHYGAMQSNFHTFGSADSTFAIQFVSEQEAARMLESMRDLLSQQHQQLLSSQASLVEPVIFRKPSKPPRRLSKKDISSPCNFKHVSGITMQRTLNCEKELRGTIQRKMRSLSLSNLSRHKSGEEGGDDKIAGRRSSKRPRNTERKISKESPGSLDMSRADPQRMSLPSHFRQRERKPLTPAHFVPPSPSHLSRTLSHSSGDIPNAHSSLSIENHHPLGTTERRHTMKEKNQESARRQRESTPTHELKRPETQEGKVQHVAIASSDIVGWTADGRLIVQMPATAATGNLTLTRRASTGQFASDKPLTQQARPTELSVQRPQLRHSTSDRAIQSRPLPLTPLDIAMPLSKPLLNSRPYPTTTTATNEPPVATPPSPQLTDPLPAGAPPPSRADHPSHSHSDSLDSSLQEVTEQMSRALAQFDELLGVVQTSL